MQKLFVLIMLVTLIIGCSGNKPKPDWIASEYYKYAKEKFNDKDYYEASNEFTVVVLRYAGSSVADSAQYYLGECHYNMDEFLISAAEFEKLINNMSRSPLVPKAQFKLADSYFELSPRPVLDQKYTEKAIREYQNFIEDYPTHELKPKAEKKISILREKLAKKKFEAAEAYRKMREFKASIIYFDIVIEKFYDSKYADNAILGKMDVYEEIEEYESLKSEYIKFKLQFPQSELLAKVESLFKSIPAEYQKIED